MNDVQKKRFAEALQRVAGDEDMLAMLATIATEDAPVMIETLDTEVQEQSLPNAAKTAHSLKGLLSTFETGEPVSELQPLIDAARRSDANEVTQLHSDMRAKLDVLMTEIKELVA